MSANDVQRLWEAKPLFHGQEGALASWQSQKEVLEFIRSALRPGMASLETGCGYSTCVFALTGSDHTCVTPAQDETRRVADYCQENGIVTDRVSFLIGKSQNVLPTLVDDRPLDLVYIDGTHRFPYPCLDWVYTEARLRLGGALLVDDVRIPTVRILHDFLIAETNWQLDAYIGDTAVFKKTAEADRTTDFLSQSYNRNYPDFSFLPFSTRLRRRYGRVGRWLNKGGKS